MWLKKQKLSPIRIQKLEEAKHVFSHVEWHMTGYRIQVAGAFPPEYIVVDKKELETVYALPNAFARYRELI